MATGISNFLSPQELHRLGRMTIQSRYVVEGTLSGRHRSHLKGASSEFADHRAYVPGDDPKHLDWKVLGRTDRYYVRRYEDETNLRVYLVIDRSASMGFTSGPVMKYRYACQLAAAIGYVVVKVRDSVGLYLYSNRIDRQAGARNSFAHLNNLLKSLTQNQPASTTQTAKTLHQIAEAVRRRALIVLFSDLLDDPPEIIRALAHFRKQHHDVIVFHILDPAELDFTFKQAAQFIDLETGETIVADPRGMADAYRKVFGDFLEQYRKPCTEMNVDYRLVRTDQDAAMFVRSFLEERKRLSK
ncbi:MAG: DUF58 domain-containing protein [Kiritimatiellaeota bacterium]|nr:DUF58 domain-containing protein [Kiritimatiellota bacterium]